MKLARTLAAACATVALASSVAMATPTAQIWIPSTDAKALKEVTVNVTNIARFSNKTNDANYYDIGFVTGLLPYEKIKLEVGADYLTTGTSAILNDYPLSFNAKLATAEDALFAGMPAFAVGIQGLGTYDSVHGSTRQNVAYGLAAKTLPVIGRISAGGYHGSERALANGSNVKENASGVMASWDRSMPEISDKLWLAVDYMSGNNANGALSFGGSWAFSKQITLLAGVQIFNPGYKPSGGESLPGGKPAFTTQLFINLP